MFTSTKEKARKLALKFHTHYERIAPLFHYETREDTREFDPESANGKTMIAVCEALLDSKVIQMGEKDDTPSAIDQWDLRFAETSEEDTTAREVTDVGFLASDPQFLEWLYRPITKNTAMGIRADANGKIIAGITITDLTAWLTEPDKGSTFEIKGISEENIFVFFRRSESPNRLFLASPEAAFTGTTGTVEYRDLGE